MADDDPFLARWSRRKAAARQDRSEEERESVPPNDDRGAPAPCATPAAAAPGAVDRLPAPDSLDASSDFTGYLAEGVPEALQRQALRVLWRTHPVIREVDGLLDYAEDYGTAGTAAGVIATVYKVGKGMIDRTGDRTGDTAAGTPPVPASQAERDQPPGDTASDEPDPTEAAGEPIGRPEADLNPARNGE